jgi:hypothetical protein
MRLLLLLLTVVTLGGCCVYQEAGTRAAFAELGDDARDLRAAVERCVQDPTANKNVCDAVMASLDNMAKDADRRSKLGQDDAKGGQP